MYFWKYKELAKALADRTLTDKQYRIYLVLFWIQMLTMPFMYLDVDSSELVIAIIGLVAWLWITYTLNKKGDGQEYFKRLVCLDLPITLRVFAIFFPLIILFFIVLGMVDPTAVEQDEPPAWIGTTISIASLVYFILAFMRGINIASGRGDKIT
jgi:hypothetical protein